MVQVFVEFKCKLLIQLYEKFDKIFIVFKNNIYFNFIIKN